MIEQALRLQGFLDLFGGATQTLRFLGKKNFLQSHDSPPPYPYKTCRLWMILRTTTQNGTQKAWKALGLEGFYIELLRNSTKSKSI